ncbi:MAG TPA: glycosyltransferase [Anaerolineae bacterium]|nr:glycosyltransferase [Anaerolineae bacterium]
MKLSVIIPSYNSAGTIGDLLEALADQQWSEPWEIIVADNGSSDQTLAIVAYYQNCLPNLKIVVSSEIRGAGHARNRGAEIAQGDYLAFCDADDIVGCGWVAAMGQALSRYDFVAGRLEAQELNEPWVNKSRSCPQQNGLQQYNYPPFLPHAASCNLGVKAAIHRAVGGYDENLFKLQDTDYCWRIQLAGTELHFVPNALVHYRLRSSMSGILRQARQWGEYNVVLYKKYRSLGMPALTWRDGLSAWYILLRQMLNLRYRGQIVRWLWELHWRIGRIRGSIKHRVIGF